MMYRVLLADDEPWIVEGLKASIDWQAEGFSIDFVASNGLDADRILREEAPDLALIDIRMPGMSGLDVIRKSRDLYPDTQFIIISGYAEFEYARVGIELNVAGYLLKPFSEDILLDQIRKVRSALDERRSEQAGQLLLDDLDHETGYLASCYPDGCLVYLQLGGRLTDLPGAALRLRLRPQHYLLISESPLELSESALPEGIRGVGCAEYQGDSLLDAMIQAETLAYGYFTQSDRRLFLTPAPSEYSGELSALHDAAYSAPEQVPACIDALRAALPNLSVSALYRLYCGLPDDRLSLSSTSMESMIRKYGTAERLLDALKAMYSPMPELTGDNAFILSSYMRAHFSEDLSFIDLCTHFSMSATAVRSQLNREVGMNFSQYLTQLRMNQAGQLLHGSLSINEIALSCGFEDPLYFRKVFKRYYHQTPSQYRAQLDSSDPLPPPEIS